MEEPIKTIWIPVSARQPYQAEINRMRSRVLAEMEAAGRVNNPAFPVNDDDLGPL